MTMETIYDTNPEFSQEAALEVVKQRRFHLEDQRRDLMADMGRISSGRTLQGAELGEAIKARKERLDRNAAAQAEIPMWENYFRNQHQIDRSYATLVREHQRITDELDQWDDVDPFLKEELDGIENRLRELQKSIPAAITNNHPAPGEGALILMAQERRNLFHDELLKDLTQLYLLPPFQPAVSRLTDNEQNLLHSYSAGLQSESEIAQEEYVRLRPDHQVLVEGDDYAIDPVTHERVNRQVLTDRREIAHGILRTRPNITASDYDNDPIVRNSVNYLRDAVAGEIMQNIEQAYGDRLDMEGQDAHIFWQYLETWVTQNQDLARQLSVESDDIIRTAYTGVFGPIESGFTAGAVAQPAATPSTPSVTPVLAPPVPRPIDVPVGDPIYDDEEEEEDPSIAAVSVPTTPPTPAIPAPPHRVVIDDEPDSWAPVTRAATPAPAVAARVLPDIDPDLLAGHEPLPSTRAAAENLLQASSYETIDQQLKSVAGEEKGILPLILKLEDFVKLFEVRIGEASITGVRLLGTREETPNLLGKVFRQSKTTSFNVGGTIRVGGVAMFFTLNLGPNKQNRLEVKKSPELKRIGRNPDRHQRGVMNETLNNIINNILNEVEALDGAKAANLDARSITYLPVKQFSEMVTIVLEKRPEIAATAEAAVVRESSTGMRWGRRVVATVLVLGVLGGIGKMALDASSVSAASITDLRDSPELRDIRFATPSPVKDLLANTLEGIYFSPHQIHVFNNEVPDSATMVEFAPPENPEEGNLPYPISENREENRRFAAKVLVSILRQTEKLRPAIRPADVSEAEVNEFRNEPGFEQKVSKFQDRIEAGQPIDKVNMKDQTHPYDSLNTFLDRLMAQHFAKIKAAGGQVLDENDPEYPKRIAKTRADLIKLIKDMNPRSSFIANVNDGVVHGKPLDIPLESDFEAVYRAERLVK